MEVETDALRKQKLDAAKTDLGTGFNFQMGAGNLLF